jgi:hypothetical protein
MARSGESRASPSRSPGGPDTDPLRLDGGVHCNIGARSIVAAAILA